MLQAADDLFVEVGYNKTTVDMIAERAEVGVATVYKYFTNKMNIAVELLRPELEKAFAQGEAILKNPPPDPADAVVELIGCYYQLRNNWNDTSVLKAIEHYHTTSGENAVHDLVLWANQKVLEQIKGLLFVFADRGALNKELNFDDVTAIIFALFDHHYQTHVFSPSGSGEQVFIDISRRLAVLFEPWRAG